VLKYDNGLTAAVAFKGNYGSGSEGAVFIMGLPFETIIDTQDQRALVSAVLEYFGLPDGASPVAAADPGDFILYGNYPNPFNITTGIRVNTPANAEMVCSVYDILGRKIMSRNFGVISAGLHTLPMDMSGVASGTYFYSVETGGSSLPGKFTLLK